MPPPLRPTPQQRLDSASFLPIAACICSLRRNKPPCADRFAQQHLSLSGAEVRQGRAKARALSRRVKGTCVSRSREQRNGPVGTRDGTRGIFSITHRQLVRASMRPAPARKTARQDISMLLRTRKGTRAETWTLRCGRPRQKSAEPLVLGIDRRLLRCLSSSPAAATRTMDRVEKLGTNISLAIAREASAAPQPPLREKLP